MLLTDTELQLKQHLFQKFFAVAKTKLQNLICFAFQARGPTRLSMIKLSKTLGFQMEIALYLENMNGWI